jgi:hypothetical protein
MAEVGWQRTEDRRQRTEDRGEMTEGRRQMIEGRGKKNKPNVIELNG